MIFVVVQDVVALVLIHAYDQYRVKAGPWHPYRRLNRSTFAACQVFWYFVVGLWPILYWQVYL